MFNLYQNSSNRQIIRSRQFNSCKLGFCLCVMEGTEFHRVSLWSYSRIFRDGKIHITLLHIVIKPIFQNNILTSNLIDLVVKKPTFYLRLYMWLSTTQNRKLTIIFSNHIYFELFYALIYIIL